MQDAPSVAAEQAFPFGIVAAVVAVLLVVLALVWWERKTRGGRTPPKGS